MFVVGFNFVFVMLPLFTSKCQKLTCVLCVFENLASAQNHFECAHVCDDSFVLADNDFEKEEKVVIKLAAKTTAVRASKRTSLNSKF